MVGRMGVDMWVFQRGGVSAFTLLESFASTLPAGEQVDLVVGYATGQEAAEHTARLEV